MKRKRAFLLLPLYVLSIMMCVLDLSKMHEIVANEFKIAK